MGDVCGVWGLPAACVCPRRSAVSALRALTRERASRRAGRRSGAQWEKCEMRPQVRCGCLDELVSQDSRAIKQRCNVCVLETAKDGWGTRRENAKGGGSVLFDFPRLGAASPPSRLLPLSCTPTTQHNPPSVQFSIVAIASWPSHRGTDPTRQPGDTREHHHQVHRPEPTSHGPSVRW